MSGNINAGAKGRTGNGSGRRGLSFMYIFAAVVTVYLIAQVVSFTNQDTTNYIVAKKGSIVETFYTEGVVVREETLVRSASSGIVRYYYPSGKELKSNTEICSILNDYYGDILQQKIDEIYAQIQDVDTGEYEDVFQSLNEDVAASISTYLRSKSINGYAQLYDLEEDLSEDVNRRKDVYSLMSNSRVVELLAQQGIYIDEQNSVIQNIFLPEAGFIDYSYDSYEGWTVEQISPDFIDSYKSQYSYFELNLQKVESGDPLYRFISSPVWHIVVYLNEEEASYFSGESNVSFIYNNTDELTGYVESLEKTDEDQYRLILKITSNVQNYLTDRIVSLVFTKNNHTGIKIPDSAIVTRTVYTVPTEYVAYVNEQNGLLVVSGQDNISFMSIDVLNSADGVTYFDLPTGLNAGATIQKPNSTDRMSLSQTADLSGVYVVNGGFTSFKIVQVVYESQGYSIVTGVNMYDRVRVGVS